MTDSLVPSQGPGLCPSRTVNTWMDVRYSTRQKSKTSKLLALKLICTCFRQIAKCGYNYNIIIFSKWALSVKLHPAHNLIQSRLKLRPSWKVFFFFNQIIALTVSID